MSCIENFTNRPIVIQLKNAVAAVHSSEEGSVEVDGSPQTCGQAAISMQPAYNAQGQIQVNPATGQPHLQPIPMQVFRGEIVALDEQGLTFQTLGGDNKTSVLIYVRLEEVQAISFAVDHPAPEEKPRIIQ